MYANSSELGMDVRAATDDEIDQLTRIWYDGWSDAHAQIVPAELTRGRTYDSFRKRLQSLPLGHSRRRPGAFPRRLLHRQGRRVVSTLRVGEGAWVGYRCGIDSRRGGSACPKRRADGVALVRDWQRARREIL